MVKKISPQQQKIFDKLAPHPVQSWAWGEFRQQQGHRVVRLGVFTKNKLVRVYQITFHRLPHLPWSIGYLPKSVLPTKEVVEALKQIGREEKAIFIKLEPNQIASQGAYQKLKNLGLIQVKSFFAKYTSVIDLTQTPEELLASFKPKTRYNIRLAQKHGVVVKEDNSDQAFEAYLRLTSETTHRQGFYAHDERYHRLQWQAMRKAGISHLLVATYQNQILATFMLFVFNKVLYYPYGASTRKHKELMAPTLLMWEAIRFGQAHGCQSFDLWGSAGPNPSPNHPYFGFHKFKEGFSPKTVEFVGTYDLVINPFLYRLYNLADYLRWKYLRLKAKL